MNSPAGGEGWRTDPGGTGAPGFPTAGRGGWAARGSGTGPASRMPPAPRRPAPGTREQPGGPDIGFPGAANGTWADPGSGGGFPPLRTTRGALALPSCPHDRPLEHRQLPGTPDPP